MRVLVTGAPAYLSATMHQPLAASSKLAAGSRFSAGPSSIDDTLRGRTATRQARGLCGALAAEVIPTSTTRDAVGAQPLGWLAPAWCRLPSAQLCRSMRFSCRGSVARGGLVEGVMEDID